MNEEELLVETARRARAGSADAKERLAVRILRWLDENLRVAIGPGILRQRSFEDVRQEVFAVLYPQLATVTLSSEAEFLTWIRTVSVNAVREIGRRDHAKKRRCPTGELDVEELSDAESPLVAGGDSRDPVVCAADLNERVRVLEAALRTLDDIDQTLIRLVHLERDSLTRAARLVGLPESTARERMKRAYNRIAVEFGRRFAMRRSEPD